MNKKIMMVTLLLGTSMSFVAVYGIGTVVGRYLSRNMSIPVVWLNEKNLLVATDEERARLGVPGETVGAIRFNLNSLRAQFARAAADYIATINPETEKALATELLRYFKISYNVATNDTNTAEIRLEAASAANPDFSHNGVSLLQKAKANKNSILVQVLTELGAK